jgi:hypothetical protein
MNTKEGIMKPATQALETKTPRELTTPEVRQAPVDALSHNPSAQKRKRSRNSTSLEDTFSKKMKPSGSSIEHQKLLANLRAISLSPEVGQQILAITATALPEDSTTACRKEEKSVIFQRTWRAIKNAVRRGDSVRNFEGVFLKSRDKQPAVGKNETFTFYGKEADLQNGAVSTKIRLRYRFYLLKQEKDTEAETIISVKRSGITSDRGWLELKIKDPSPDLPEGVFKLRARVLDEDLRTLFDFDPMTTSPEVLEGIKSRALADPQNTPEQVNALLGVVAILGNISPDLVKPQIVSSYERASYQHQDRATGFLGAAPQYQITLDTDVKGFGVHRTSDKDILDFGQYYGPDSKKSITGYPKNATVIEYKTPFNKGGMANAFATPDAEFLHATVVERMQSPTYVVPNFDINKGKAATYRDQLAEIIDLAPQGELP